MEQGKIKSALVKALAEVVDDVRLMVALGRKEQARARWLGAEAMFINCVAGAFGENEVNEQWVSDAIKTPPEIAFP